MSRSRIASSTGEAGYFMADAVVGLFVLASVAASLMGAFGLSKALASRAEHTAKGLVVARSCIEEQVLEERGRTLVLDGLEYGELRSLQVLEVRKDDVAELVRISCVVKWTETGSPREIRLERVEVRASTPTSRL
jgi:hypothetical protein